MNVEQQSQIRENLIASQNWDALFVSGKNGMPGQGFDWVAPRQTLAVEIEGGTAEVVFSYEKAKFVVATCDINQLDCRNMHDAARKIKAEIAKNYSGFMLIVCGNDGGGAKQNWSLKLPGEGLPKRADMEWREDDAKGENHLVHGTLLNTVFTLQEELQRETTIVDVTGKMSDGWQKNTPEKAKKFNKQFVDCIAAFEAEIEGMDDEPELRHEYAVQMVNRLMFIYFLQKKGFMDCDENYLQNKLAMMGKKGKDKFSTVFYPQLLSKLFDLALNTPISERDSKTMDEIKRRGIGKVPYVNGGLFDVEKIDRRFKVKDAAFSQLFDFFDQFHWIIDNTIMYKPSEDKPTINPDIMGYMFENLLNEQKRGADGAFYTNKDVTRYVTDHTLIAHILKRVKELHPSLFKPSDIDSVWSNLQNDAEKYVYKFAKTGMNVIEQVYEQNKENLNLRDKVEDTLHHLQDTPQGKFYNAGETWYDALRRVERTRNILQKMRHGEIATVEQLTECNLDIRQFLLDAVSRTDSVGFVKDVFTIMAGEHVNWAQDPQSPQLGLKVLDPTCGSGAFIFTAMETLEEVYLAAIDRMQNMVYDHDNKIAGKAGTIPQWHRHFSAILRHINAYGENMGHENPDPRYWVYKKIMLENLHGVDIMPEAVEIAKLQLFLKLASAAKFVPNNAKCNYGLDPIPDLDFNIVDGNTLLGYTTLDSILDGRGKLDMPEEEVEEIRGLSESVNQNYRNFMAAQSSDLKRHEKSKLKGKLIGSIEELNDKLDGYMYKTNPATQDGGKPLHWYSAFYETMISGGFDVVLGNPPYAGLRNADKPRVTMKNGLKSTGDLCYLVMERLNDIIQPDANYGLVVTLSAYASKDAEEMQNKQLDTHDTMFLSFYPSSPGKLFDDAETSNAICLASMKQGQKTDKERCRLYTTKLHRWENDDRLGIDRGRDALFHNIEYTPTITQQKVFTGTIERSAGAEMKSLMRKIRKFGKAETMKDCTEMATSRHKDENAIHYRFAGGRYYKPFFDKHMGAADKKIYFKNKADKYAAIAVYSSGLYFKYYLSVSDNRNNSPTVIRSFPVSLNDFTSEHKRELASLGRKLTDNMRKNKEGDTFHMTSAALEIIDQIDLLIGKAYRFNEREVAYILHADHQYRIRGKGIKRERSHNPDDTPLVSSKKVRGR